MFSLVWLMLNFTESKQLTATLPNYSSKDFRAGVCGAFPLMGNRHVGVRGAFPLMGNRLAGVHETFGTW